MSPPPRIRMIAGPNGSGKSTIKALLPGRYMSNFVNADEIEASLRHHGFVDLRAFGLEHGGAHVIDAVVGSGVLRDHARPGLASVVQAGRD